MGNKDFKDYKDISIQILSDKICYFPGEIVSGKILIMLEENNSFNNLPDNCELSINITQYQHYIEYSQTTTGEDTHYDSSPVKEITKLVEIKHNIADIINQNSSNKDYSLPFSLRIPNYANPTILHDSETFSKNFVNAEIPSIKLTKSKMIVIKSIFPNTSLKNYIILNHQYDKTKFLVKKGSYKIKIELPKNFFYYDEKIPYEINIDYSNLKTKIKYVVVSIFRKIRKNQSNDHSKIYRIDDGSIIKKKYDVKYEKE